MLQHTLIMLGTIAQHLFSQLFLNKKLNSAIYICFKLPNYQVVSDKF